MARQIVDLLSPAEALWAELATEISERDINDGIRGEFIRVARKLNSKIYTYRNLGKLLGISHTTAIKLAETK